MKKTAKKTREDTLDSDILDAARRLVAHMESGQRDDANEVLEELTQLRESELFREVGSLTRELHEALKTFKMDSRLSAFADEIPDTRERLNHVITMTEASAHRTLNAVEESLILTDAVADNAARLAQRWQTFRRREMSADDFRELSRDLEHFLAQTGDQTKALNNHLTEALMAQDYQDLTGQIIRRVINLVHEVETGLVSMISLSGSRRTGENPKAADKPSKGSEPASLEGPQVPGIESDTALKGQDEVDDLLSSLGF